MLRTRYSCKKSFNIKNEKNNLQATVTNNQDKQTHKGRDDRTSRDWNYKQPHDAGHSRTQKWPLRSVTVHVQLTTGPEQKPIGLECVTMGRASHVQSWADPDGPSATVRYLSVSFARRYHAGTWLCCHVVMAAMSDQVPMQKMELILCCFGYKECNKSSVLYWLPLQPYRKASPILLQWCRSRDCLIFYSR